MSYLFSGCSSLISLPDISKWNVNNVNNMSFLFSGCSSLFKKFKHKSNTIKENQTD